MGRIQALRWTLAPLCNNTFAFLHFRLDIIAFVWYTTLGHAMLRA